MPRAASLAAELQERFGYASELIKLSGGVFEVYSDDKLIFSKSNTGRFPDDGEVVKLLNTGAKK